MKREERPNIETKSRERRTQKNLKLKTKFDYSSVSRNTASLLGKGFQQDRNQKYSHQELLFQYQKNKNKTGNARFSSQNGGRGALPSDGGCPSDLLFLAGGGSCSLTVSAFSSFYFILAVA